MGPNAAMLDQKGRLTDIGSWYLGGAATNNVPKSSAAAGMMGLGLDMEMLAWGVAVVGVYAWGGVV